MRPVDIGLLIKKYTEIFTWQLFKISIIVYVSHGVYQHFNLRKSIMPLCIFERFVYVYGG